MVNFPGDLKQEASRQAVPAFGKQHDLKQVSLTVTGDGSKFGLDDADEVTIILWTFRGFVDVYFLVFLHLGTRCCWISPSTVHPDSAWSCQQARNFLMHSEDIELPPKYVLRDNDAKYTVAFDEVFKSIDAEVLKNTPQSPNLRARV